MGTGACGWEGGSEVVRGRQTDGRAGGRASRKTDGETDGQMDGGVGRGEQVDRGVGGWMDRGEGWMERQMSG